MMYVQVDWKMGDDDTITFDFNVNNYLKAEMSIGVNNMYVVCWLFAI
jgi:hypothetical protein